jgi:hypothetical protein
VDGAIGAEPADQVGGLLTAFDGDQVVRLLDGGEQRRGQGGGEFAAHLRGAQGVVLPREHQGGHLRDRQRPVAAVRHQPGVVLDRLADLVRRLFHELPLDRLGLP